MLIDRLFGGGPGERPRCAVVTPIGPGHGDLYGECEASVRAAWRKERGPFAALEFMAVDDSEGRLGRSRARNEGVRRAHAAGARWIFFLDADDVMLPEAFGHLRDLVGDYDAVWGLIASRRLGAAEPHLRLPQILSLNRIEQLLVFDPFLTLQMGHFVRTEAALATPFDEALDAGEDFDYYLRLWQRFRCAKVTRAFFAARQGRRSGGPRGATAEAWGEAVRARLNAERKRLGLDPQAPEAIAVKNASVAELQGFYRSRGLASPESFRELARAMPFRGLHEIASFHGAPFRMYSDNDDAACLSLAWTGEYEYVSTRLWQQLARRARTILDLGAGTGFYSLLAARAAEADAVIYCFEPLAENYLRLRRNIEANHIENVRTLPVGKTGRTSEVVAAMHHEACAADLIRIDAVLVGRVVRILEQRQPDLLLRMTPGAPLTRVGELLPAAGYRLYALDDAEYRVRPVARLAAGAAGNCWATVRDDAGVAAIVRESGGTLAADSDR